MICPILELTKQLIQRKSISPNDFGCQEIIMARLKSIGFFIEKMNFNKTSNIWAWKGFGKNTLMFLGHTDVVPAGDIQYWKYHPFIPVLEKNILYGRGASDMKGSIASMIIAVERFIFKYPNHNGRLSFIFTSDEESDSKHGTVKVIEHLIDRKEKIDYCLIGEPSSKYNIGDTIKCGRRGSITANLTIYGIQGHVAYVNSKENSIHHAILILRKLIDIQWDSENKKSIPTTMQIVNIHSGTGLSNTISKCINVELNFRFDSWLSEDFIKKRVNDIISSENLNYTIKWNVYAKPFYTKPGKLLDVVSSAVNKFQKIMPNVEIGGGTSDGRFAISICDQIIELGLKNTTIHKENECVHISDLQILSNIYQCILTKLML